MIAEEWEEQKNDSIPKRKLHVLFSLIQLRHFWFSNNDLGFKMHVGRTHTTYARIVKAYIGSLSRVEGCISCYQEIRNENVWNMHSIMANLNLGQDVANKRGRK